jgi:hypothetical protein
MFGLQHHGSKSDAEIQDRVVAPHQLRQVECHLDSRDRTAALQEYTFLLDLTIDLVRALATTNPLRYGIMTTLSIRTVTVHDNILALRGPFRHFILA